MSSEEEIQPLLADAPTAVNADALLKRRYVTGALMLVMVLASMEQTVTSTVMPTIIGELHGLRHYSWVASIYLLACTASMPLYGRLADALGRKRVILFAIGLFCLASLLASTAHSMAQLIIYRGIQGLGAGGIMPVVLTILGDIFTIEERARVQGFFTAIWGTSSLAGPALGALLLKTLGWRSVFFINLPVGVLSLFVLMWKYHDRERRHRVDLDLPGAITLAVGCMMLLTLVSRIGSDGWPLGVGVALTTGVAAAGIYFYGHERRTSHPILPPNLLVTPTIGPAMVGSGLLGIGFFALDTYVPLYMQGARGGGAVAAASVVTPVMLAWALSSFIAAKLLAPWGFRKTAVVGSVLILLGFIGLLACAMADGPRWILISVLAVTGFGFGPTSMSYLLAAQEVVQFQQRGVITSGVAFFRTMGGAVGIQIMLAIFNLLTSEKLAALEKLGVTPGSLLDPRRRLLIPPDILAEASQRISSGLCWVFGLMVLCAALGVLVAMRMPRTRSGHRITALEAAESLAG